jgi:hypothetical protein
MYSSLKFSITLLIEDPFYTSEDDNILYEIILPIIRKNMTKFIIRIL